MNVRIFSVLVFMIGLTGPAAEAASHDQVELSYDILDPSPHLAIRYQKRKDYSTAILLNEAILKRDPSDRQALKRMVECHEALVKKDRQSEPETARRPKADPDDGFSDLPNLTLESPDTRQLAQDPGRR